MLQQLLGQQGGPQQPGGIESDPNFDPEAQAAPLGEEEEGPVDTESILDEIMQLARLGIDSPDTDPTEMKLFEDITSRVATVRERRFKDQQQAMGAGAGNMTLQRAFGQLG
jgi:hypothetical protein